MLEIRRVDPADEEAVSTWDRLYREAWRAFDPDADLADPAECRSALQPGPAASHGWEGYLAYDGPVAVGTGTLVLRLTDNTDRAVLWVHVPPDHAGEGVGTTLLTFLEDRARRLQKRWALIEPREDNPAAMALARRSGYRLDLVNVERRRALPIPDDLLDALEHDAAPHVAPYRVEVLVGPLPEPLLPTYAALKNRMMTDAPHGELDQAPGERGPEHLRDTDAQLVAGGAERVTAVALHGDGTVVGLSELVVQAEGPAILQWATIVDPSARGHRLGLAMKVAGARVAQQRRPDRTCIITDNVEVNAPMIAINEALGFEIYATFAEMHKEL